MKKFIIKYLPLLLLWALFTSWGLYGTMVRQKKIYEEYNGMSGTVTSFSVSSYSASVHCNIRLENGMYGAVNNGYSMVRVGQTWINSITDYIPILGLTGFAYFIVPGEVRCIIESLLVLILFIIPAFLSVMSAMYISIGYWIKNH